MSSILYNYSKLLNHLLVFVTIYNILQFMINETHHST
jgi:hypothetical protein